MRALAALAALAALGTGCGIADFDIDQPIVEQRILGSGIPAPIAGLLPIPLDLDLSAEIAAMESGPIDSITLTSIRLTITDTLRPEGDTDDWAFVSSIHVFVRGSMQGTTLSRREIANVDFPGAVQAFDFDIVDGVDLKPYVDEGATVDSEGQGTVPTDDVSYDGVAVFTVHPL